MLSQLPLQARLWRVSQIKQMGSIEGQPLLSANKWEEVEGKGEQAIKDWIATNMRGKDCLVVLVGKNTAGRKWVNYEIKEAWKLGMGVCGVYIHNLKDSEEKQTTKGSNPFSDFNVGDEPLTKYAKMYDPPSNDSSTVYGYISENLDAWVKEAIRLRG